MNIFLLLLIGISLSMDAFSLALSLGTFKVPHSKQLLFTGIVGIFHFVMPLLGMLLGNSVENLFKINNDYLLSLIFIFIIIEMIIDLRSKEDKEYNLSFFNMIIYAFSVSLDSFTVGIGVKNITSIPLLASLIFCSISMLFTYSGVWIGNFSYEKLGNISKLIGLVIMIIITLIHIF